MTGTMFKTRTGELTTVDVSDFRLLVKSCGRADKHHGVTDKELPPASPGPDDQPGTQRVFGCAAAASTAARFLEEKGFLDRDPGATQAIPGSAEARPFVTSQRARP